MALRQTAMAKEWGFWSVDISGSRQMGFLPGPRMCGVIRDGIALKTTGPWRIVSFADFEAMYLLAKKARENDEATQAHD